MKIVSIYGSMREESNSKKVTSWILEKYRNTSKITEWDLFKISLPFFKDQRHFESPDWLLPKDMENILNSLQEANTIIFSTPLYWYGVSASMKNLFDWLSYPLYLDRKKFKASLTGKNVTLVVAGSESDPDSYKALQLQMEKTTQYLGMNFKSTYICIADSFKELLNNKEEQKKAQSFLI